MQIRNLFCTKNNYSVLLRGFIRKLLKTEEIGISRQTDVSNLRNINGLMVSFSDYDGVFI
jgi:hypothetical protein